MKHHYDQDESYAQPEYNNDEYELDQVDHDRQKEIRRKLDERIERRRLKAELEDYEGELDDFEWDEDK